MAEAITVQTLKIIVDLNKKEAEYLKGLLQNYVGDDVRDEPDDHYAIRKELFELLDKSLKEN